MLDMQSRDAAPKQPKGGHLDVGAVTNFFSDPHNRRQWWQRLFAELLGTFLLTLVAAGADVIGAATGRPADSLARYVAPALLVMAMIYTIGNVSGAHLNPVVTLAFSLRRDFPRGGCWAIGAPKWPDHCWRRSSCWSSSATGRT